MITTSAPGKIILFGEHAMVYGEAAIATAVDKRAYVTACKLEEPKIVIESRKLNTTIEAQIEAKTKNPLVKAVKEALKKTEARKGVGIEIKSQIPISVGLGASASVFTAAASAVLNLFNGGANQEDLYDIVQKAEKLVFEEPSGLDTAITTRGGTLNFQQGKVEEINAQNLGLVIGNTRIRKNTMELIESVRKHIEDPRMACSMFNIGAIVKQARTAIENNDSVRIGQLMDKNHEFLRKLGVSSPALENLVSAAKDAGALGAKLTGAGGGGCIIALTDDPDNVIVALQEAGGTAFRVNTNQQGVRVES